MRESRHGLGCSVGTARACRRHDRPRCYLTWCASQASRGHSQRIASRCGGPARYEASGHGLALRTNNSRTLARRWRALENESAAVERTLGTAKANICGHSSALARADATWVPLWAGVMEPAVDPEPLRPTLCSAPRSLRPFEVSEGEEFRTLLKNPAARSPRRHCAVPWFLRPEATRGAPARARER